MSATVLYDIQRILERTGGAHPAIPDPLFSLADTVLYRIRDLLLLGASGAGSSAASGSSMAFAAQTEIDFGAGLYQSEASFTITDATVSPTSIILASLSGDAPTGKDADETEMDPLVFTTTAGTGTFTLRVSALSGDVHDKFKVDYIVV